MKKLKEKLERIHKKQYGVYRSLRGTYSFVNFDLQIEHVQSDPFAPPSRITIKIPFEESFFPNEWLTDIEKRIALSDFIIRGLHQDFKTMPSEIKQEKIKGGNFTIAEPKAQILKRNNIQFIEGSIIAQFYFNFPAWGRVIHSEYACQQLLTYLPNIIVDHCFYQPTKHDALEAHIQNYTDQIEVREYLQKNNYLSFIPNGAILARQQGGKFSDNKPEKNSLPFNSPKNFTHTITLKSGHTLTGMLLKQGVHLIVGGSFHGKSTILEAIETGIYPHIQNDGREFVSTIPSAVKIKAENGRLVHPINISPFIKNLPLKMDVGNFSTRNASGSTSQASSILESISVGSQLLLLDEDTCATNLMIKDEDMTQLISHEKDPIQPFIYRIRELYENECVSSILIMGSVGHYFSQADSILEMNEFQMTDLTTKAKQIAKKQYIVKIPNCPRYIWRQQRFIKTSIKKIDLEKIKVIGNHILKIGSHKIDCSNLEQIQCTEQLYTIGYWILNILENENTNLQEICELIDIANFEGRFNKLPIRTNYAEIRGIDVLSVINRHPGIKITLKPPQNEE